jgi:UDP-3-O-[3-hydroxymyristoyl] glucosamine N-acyltransferase
MRHPGFFERAGPFPLHVLATRLGVEIAAADDRARTIEDVKSLSEAGPADLSFAESRKYAGQLSATQAGACVLAESLAESTPAHTVAMVSPTPYRSFIQAMQIFYPSALRSLSAESSRGSRGGDLIHKSAVIDDSVTIEPGAIVGPEARIGAGTVISAGAVIGYRCIVGRDCSIGPNATLMHTIVGDRVIIHAGARIGQDGFGYSMGSRGHLKIPQIGRVVIHDDVEIGAGTCIDRGALKDTIVGEGTKIDNLVQVAHNVVFGKHCVVAGQSGFGGSAVIEDFVVLGAQAGVKDHVRIGRGCQLAAKAGVVGDLEPGTIVSGFPARPFKEWAREVAAVKRLAARSGKA